MTDTTGMKPPPTHELRDVIHGAVGDYVAQYSGDRDRFRDLTDAVVAAIWEHCTAVSEYPDKVTVTLEFKG